MFTPLIRGLCTTERIPVRQQLPSRLWVLSIKVENKIFYKPLTFYISGL